MKCSVKTVAAELFLEKWVNAKVFASSDLLFDRFGSLLEKRIFFRVNLGGLLATESRNIVALVPLFERSSIDLDDVVLYKSVCTDNFVSGRIVHYFNDTGFTGN